MSRITRLLDAFLRRFPNWGTEMLTVPVLLGAFFGPMWLTDLVIGVVSIFGWVHILGWLERRSKKLAEQSSLIATFETDSLSDAIALAHAARDDGAVYVHVVKEPGSSVWQTTVSRCDS